LSKHIGKPAEQIRQDSERDFFLTAEAAKKYGIVDEVLVPKNKPARESTGK
jgi:ATP-dependent Clp protease protease subunit